MDETARLWVIRVQDESFDDWDGFTVWLEADPSHRAAYERALDDDAWANGLFTLSAPIESLSADAPEMLPPARRRWPWLATGGALAASLALFATWIATRPSAPQSFATAPGEHRTIALADGSQVLLNGDTRISLNPDRPREVTLAQGEALFTVRHDAAQPFMVIASGARLLDAGTVFNVVAQSGMMRVAVAEGAVIFEPGRQQVQLNPGDSLSLARAGARPMVNRISIQSVGSWRQCQLLYDNAPLDEIARDLGRNIGRAIRVRSDGGASRFTGTLNIEGTPGEVMARAGSLLGVRFEAEGDVWIMTPTHAMSQ